MATYTIEKVSQQRPREYEGQHGVTYYIKVKLAGVEKPVSIGKKRPDALKDGDTVHGTIIPTDFDTDKFKAEQQAFAPKDNKVDQSEIKAQFAIKAAVQLLQGKTENLETVESVAKDLFAMVDRVKNGEVEQASGKQSESWQKIKQKFTQTDDAPPPSDEDAPINLDDIPF